MYAWHGVCVCVYMHMYTCVCVHARVHVCVLGREVDM